SAGALWESRRPEAEHHACHGIRTARQAAMRGSRLALALGCTAFAGGYAIGRLLCAYDFRHQNVVIAGGSRGLGLVIARQLAREEARVILLARDPAELQAAVKQLHDHGAVAKTYVCDVSNRPQVESTFHAIGRD